VKIVYISQYYPPEMGAPAARVSAFARRWAAMGHDVTVVTTFPNHPTGIIPPAYRGHLRLIENDQGVRVVRTFLYPAANKGLIKRALCYASFALSSVLQGYGLVGRPDVVIATSPQFLVTLSGWAMSRLKGVPLVTEIRDLWPDSIVAVGALPAGSPLVGGLRVLERFVYRQSDARRVRLKRCRSVGVRFGRGPRGGPQAVRMGWSIRRVVRRDPGDGTRIGRRPRRGRDP